MKSNHNFKKSMNVNRVDKNLGISLKCSPMSPPSPFAWLLYCYVDRMCNDRQTVRQTYRKVIK